MKEDKIPEEEKIRVVIDNMAIPEIRIGEDKKNDEEKPAANGIDFDAAIPEYHSHNE